MERLPAGGVGRRPAFPVAAAAMVAGVAVVAVAAPAVDTMHAGTVDLVMV